MVCHRTYNVVLFPRIGFETAVMYSVNNFHETQEKENKQKLLELTFFFSFFFFYKDNFLPAIQLSAIQFFHCVSTSRRIAWFRFAICWLSKVGVIIHSKCFSVSD